MKSESTQDGLRAAPVEDAFRNWAMLYRPRYFTTAARAFRAGWNAALAAQPEPPTAPSEAIVERVAEAIWRAHHKEPHVPEFWNAENWERLARAALAALSEEAIDA